MTDTDARFDVLMAAVARGIYKRRTVNQAHVQAEAARTEIASRLDNICRIVDDLEPRLACAADEGAKLAAAVYAFLQDPEGVGRDSLKDAHDEFVSMHAGNFWMYAAQRAASESNRGDA